VGCGTRGGWDAREARGAEPGRGSFRPGRSLPSARAKRRDAAVFPRLRPTSMDHNVCRLWRSSRVPGRRLNHHPGVLRASGPPRGIRGGALRLRSRWNGLADFGATRPAASVVQSRVIDGLGARHRRPRCGSGRCNPQCVGECGATRGWRRVAAPVRGGRQRGREGLSNGMGVRKERGAAGIVAKCTVRFISSTSASSLTGEPARLGPARCAAVCDGRCEKKGRARP
jgi:hypothetical protein